ncbi:translation initiation factor 2 [Desulfovibrio sp.]|uniref:translation initiation factor 2 n=1 Tax=Desulfovibrio sp. TaxID=885 RepID=UPI0025C2BE34|nr:translation initiation factor 2 [Desulfovibrio sp.]
MKTGLYPAARNKRGRNWAADALFVVLAALYAMAVAQGIVSLSGHGAELDSDLSCYAFAMAGEHLPDNFHGDPLLHEVTPANSLWNLQQFAAELLTPGDQYAVGLLWAGALIIFVYLVSMYLLGRWLYGSPGPALMLALLMSVTVWVGWGTFWGVTHSDPVPRTFFAALWPFMLMGAVAAMRHAFWRPVAMLAAGLGMWVHGLGALNTGAMFFMAFFFCRPAGWSWAKHLGNLTLCLIFFFVPVLTFLWPSLGQKQAFSPADIEMFHELFSQRWAKDYGRFAERLALFLSWSKPNFWILLAGFGSWLVVRRNGSPRLRQLAAMCPAFVLALALVSTFSWLESLLAPPMGRLPMAHEFVRGLRYLIPLAWIMLAGVLALFWPRMAAWLRVGLCALAVLLMLLCNGDRQNVAALYSIAGHTGLPMPYMSRAEGFSVRAGSHREALLALKEKTVPGDTVFSNSGDLGVRYMAQRGLFLTFKDGYHPYYNKNSEQAREWLANEKLRLQSPTGYVDVWLQSGLPWLFCDRPQDRAMLEKYGNVVWENSGWLIVRRHEGGMPAGGDSASAVSGEKNAPTEGLLQEGHAPDQTPDQTPGQTPGQAPDQTPGVAVPAP